MNRPTCVHRPVLVATILIASLMGSRANASEPSYPLLNEWWQWALSFPAAVNPILDNTGKLCSLGQHGPLWFFAGNTGGKTVRSCTIPTHTRVLIPVHNEFCFVDSSFTAQQCYDAVAQDFATFTVADATVDGQSIRAGLVPNADFVEEFPVSTEANFVFVIPKDGLFSYKPGLYRSVAAAGRWALASFDTAGAHTLRVRAQSTTGFSLDVTYRLTVVDVN